MHPRYPCALIVLGLLAFAGRVAGTRSLSLLSRQPASVTFSILSLQLAGRCLRCGAGMLINGPPLRIRA